MNEVRGTECWDLIGQHTPAVISLGWERNDVVSEELSSQEVEWFALEWLGMVVGNHLVSGTIFHFNVSFLDLVCQIKITNVKGTGAFGRALLTVVQ